MSPIMDQGTWRNMAFLVYNGMVIEAIWPGDGQDRPSVDSLPRFHGKPCTALPFPRVAPSRMRPNMRLQSDRLQRAIEQGYGRETVEQRGV